MVFSDAGQSFLLTSYNTIRAATREPAPEIKVRKGDEELVATLNGWDSNNDLALLVIDKPNLKRLEWAEGSPPAVVGDRVFVVSGLGAAGGAISQGFVADVSGNGIQHDSPVGAAFQGGPLINSQGRVLGVASRTLLAARLRSRRTCSSRSPSAPPAPTSSAVRASRDARRTSRRGRDEVS